MLLQLEKGRKLGCPWYFPALADSLMFNMGLCSPNTAPPIHKRHQPRLLWHSHPRKAVLQALQERNCFQLLSLSQVWLKHASGSR